MERIERAIEVHVPVHVAYNQWTQFEQFPSFMQGIKEVRQLDEQHLHWVAEIGGKEKEWDAEIVEQVPDRRVAWRSVGGTANGGVVEFSPLSEGDTQVIVRMEYEPEGFIENVADFFGATSNRVEGDLARFKEFIESRGTETGAWRGEIGAGEHAGASHAGHTHEQTYTVGSGTAAGAAMHEQAHEADYDRSTGSTSRGTSHMSGTRAAATGLSGSAASASHRSASGETVIPEVREELKVGKREVEHGGVRVHSEVKEERAEEQVRLREERAQVEHRAADRPVQPGEDVFQERTIEVRETAEEPVVSKQARVVGEVAVGKEASERTETVGDTLRRTEVHVDQIADNAFRTDWQSRYASQGGRYEDYQPAYTYGHGLRNQYAGRDWADIESDVRRDWETRQPGTWERFKEAIRSGWTGDKK